MGVASVGAGDLRLTQLLVHVSPIPAGQMGEARRLEAGAGGKGGSGAWKAPRGVTSLFPPGLRLIQLKRVFPVGLLSQDRPAQPPGTGPETCTTPPRLQASSETRPKGGAPGEAGERGSWVPAGAASLRGLFTPATRSNPVGSQSHPDRFWDSFLGPVQLFCFAAREMEAQTVPIHTSECLVKA